MLINATNDNTKKLNLILIVNKISFDKLQNSGE